MNKAGDYVLGFLGTILIGMVIPLLVVVVAIVGGVLAVCVIPYLLFHYLIKPYIRSL